MASFVTLSHLLRADAVAEHCTGLIWATASFVSKGTKNVPEKCLVYTYSVTLGFSKYIRRKNRNV